jgi:CHASE1-domain containing sensor protein
MPMTSYEAISLVLAGMMLVVSLTATIIALVIAITKKK